jgi:hypothetical protein
LVQKTGFDFQAERDKTKDKEFLATQAEIIHSPLIIKDALQAAPLPDLRPEDDPVKIALDNLRVSPVVSTDVLHISFRGGGDAHTVAFIEAVVEAYQRHLKTLEQDNNAQTLELLTRRDKDLRTELKALQQEYLVHHKASPFVLQRQGTTNVDTELLRQLSAQVAASRARRVEIENVIQTLTAFRESFVSRTGDPVRFASARQPATEAEPGQGRAADLGQFNELASHLLNTVSNVAVKELVDMHAELRQAVARET